MIRVEGPNPTTLWRRLEHHAPAVVPLAHAVLDAIVFGPIGQDEQAHTLRQSKEGANSFSLQMADGRQHHFRSHDYESIEIYDSFKEGELLATLRTPEEAQAFVEGLE